MTLALSLGRRGLGRVWPNPAVGCVIVDDGRIIGRGWTAPGGRPHAEPQALAQAGALAQGGTAYVTLEPCAHTGETPPCTDALIAAGIARVVAAMEDPDPRVSGAGLERLRKVGIAVTLGVGAEQASFDHAGFLSRVTRGRPMVTLKLATTLDGRIATASGDSQWITGPQSRRVVHGLRLTHDAVMIGAGTLRADAPALTVRGFGAVAQPVRVVVGGTQPIEAESLLAGVDSAPVWLAHGSGAEVSAAVLAGAKSLPVDVGKTGLPDPTSLCQALGAAGLTRVLVEGGGLLAASLLQAGLVDRLALFTGGKAIGAEGRAALGPLGLDRLTEAPGFDLVSTRAVGGDTFSLWCKT